MHSERFMRLALSAAMIRSPSFSLSSLSSTTTIFPAAKSSRAWEMGSKPGSGFFNSRGSPSGKASSIACSLAWPFSTASLGSTTTVARTAKHILDALTLPHAKHYVQALDSGNFTAGQGQARRHQETI